MDPLDRGEMPLCSSPNSQRSPGFTLAFQAFPAWPQPTLQESSLNQGLLSLVFLHKGVFLLSRLRSVSHTITSWGGGGGGGGARRSRPSNHAFPNKHL